MANWTGTYSFSSPNLPTGTATAGGNDSLVDSGNTFKTTGAGLTNMTLRLLTGTGAGQERLIISNTANQIYVVPDWTVNPTAGTTYEIVIRLKTNDHITANVIFDTGVITELTDSAVIYFDGLYYIQGKNTAIFRWNKTKSTMVTFMPTLSGNSLAGFWNYIYIDNTVTNEPAISFLKLENSAYGVIVHFGASITFENIYNIWSKNMSQTNIYVGAPTAGVTTTKKFPTKHLIQRNMTGIFYYWSPTVSGHTGTHEMRDCWLEDLNLSSTSGMDLGYSTNYRTFRKEIIKNNIFKNAFTYVISRMTSDSLARLYLLDNYASPSKDSGSTSNFLYCQSATSPSGISYNQGNVLKSIKLQGAADYHSTVTLKCNDAIGYNYSQPAYDGLASQPNKTGDVTSDRDYIAGWAGTSTDRADLSNSTTSTETPQQYKNFNQARTNARSSRNKPLSIDNISTSSLTSFGITVTFDCQNGDDFTAVTVNSDSNSGQKVLSVSSTTDFIEEETIEIGKGTARYETGIIDSISAGVSVTLKSNLTYTHTSAQADTVKKCLRQIAIGGIIYGTTSGVYTSETYIPSKESFGAIYCGFTPENTIDDGYSFKSENHSVALTNLKSNTTYYYKAMGINPLDEILYSTEQSFTTLPTGEHSHVFIS